MDCMTEFLNVDLDIQSAIDLTPLLAALKPVAFALHGAAHAPVLRVTLELNEGNPRSADDAIRKFSTALLALAPDERRLWDGASVRVFSIGIDAGTRPHSFTVGLQASTVQMVADLGASVECVVYAVPADDGT